MWGNFNYWRGIVNRFICNILHFFGVDAPLVVPYVHRLAAGANGMVCSPASACNRKARFVNVTVENIGPCKRLLRVEGDVTEVEKAFDEVTRDFLKHASLPGFRPGKAPKDMVVRRFEKEIQEETTNKLVHDLYKAAVEKEKLKVFNIVSVEECKANRGQPFQVTVTVELEPEFELPQYKQIPVTVQVNPVTEADVDKAIEALRQQRKTYRTVERPLTAEDVAVINATGTVDGVPLSQKLGAAAAPYDSVKGFWVGAQRELGPNFFTQLVGAKAGEKRTVEVVYPADFGVKEFANQKVQYEVEVAEVKEAVLPPVGDELAKEYDAENLAALREGVRKDLENEARYQELRQVLGQVAQRLVDSVHFEVPESMLQSRTRMEVYNQVAALQQRGLSPEQIEEQKNDIYEYSHRMALARLKLDLILERIAKAENIQLTKEELADELTMMAYQRQADLKTFISEVQKSGELASISHRVLMNKVLDFVAGWAELNKQAASEPSPTTPPPA